MEPNFPQILRDAADLLTEKNWLKGAMFRYTVRQQNFYDDNIRPDTFPEFRLPSGRYLFGGDKPDPNRHRHLCEMCALGAVAVASIARDRSSVQILEDLFSDLTDTILNLDALSFPISAINDNARSVHEVKEYLRNLADMIEQMETKS